MLNKHGFKTSPYINLETSSNQSFFDTISELRQTKRDGVGSPCFCQISPQGQQRTFEEHVFLPVPGGHRKCTTFGATHSGKSRPNLQTRAKPENMLGTP